MESNPNQKIAIAGTQPAVFANPNKVKKKLPKSPQNNAIYRLDHPEMIIADVKPKVYLKRKWPIKRANLLGNPLQHTIEELNNICKLEYPDKP